MSNAWYTICINGKRNGFFKSQRGVKQGDPILPSLFIIASEVLSRLLNKLYEDKKFNGFNMPTNGPSINHLSYADDIIIFSSGKSYTLMKIMKCLKDYQENSGQMINEGKSCFLMDDSISSKRVNIVAGILNFQRANFPITYLGCPIFVGRKNIQYFSFMATKILQKLDSWQCKTLSNGGKIILIKHVLSAIPVHLLSICMPPKTIFKQIESIFANLFGDKGDDEGGIGVRSLQEIAESFSAKLWWTFRTAESLWTKFMKAKYSMRIHPMARKWNYAHSHTWRRLMKIRDKVDHLIHWKINKGNSNIWWDKWMGTGKLARLNTNTSINSPLHQYIHHKEWDTNKLLKNFPLEMVNNIQNIKIHSLDHRDIPIWTPTCDGKFTCKSAWNAMREPNHTSLVWSSGDPGTPVP
ncbi:uncharacterized protein LOC132053847 [Lycium ferocissimum]|uniref:uncharacterized protein LOC132053847 n=1 Tax=Lycium ferocissimum TaxID=112874 RepID=UPI002814BBD5|nr:uncharacterized protein LOC132053847 [Lycium ferocissimum]